MKIGIYRIKNSINNKIYIGSTKNIEARWAKHKALLRHNKHQNAHLQNAWNKYGENAFIFEVIEECKIKDLINREQFFIDNLNPEYNQTAIAGKVEMTPERRDKLSKSVLKAYKEGRLEGTTKVIYQYDLRGNYLRSFESLKQAVELTKVDLSHLSEALNGKKNVVGGYVWRFYKVDKLDVWFNRMGRPLTKEPYRPKKKYNKN
jgi:predicted GIY-YIG superfamily endonuclease